MAVVHPVDATEEELWAGPCKVFLPRSEDCASANFGGAATPEIAGRLLDGVGTRKEEGLVSLEDGATRGVYDVVLTFLLPCKSRPYNSFFASIAN